MQKQLYSLILGALLILATRGFALSSGPGMPEYTDFESVDNTDLVNLATGDFTYSIPVMTVPGPGLGFPIVLSYHAGIKPEQEASWVGLGWNLQAGAITREVNNVPDDFQGRLIDEQLTSQHISGWMASITWNAFTVGLSYDSEKGLGGMVGISMGEGISGTPLAVSGGFTVGVNGVYEGVGISAGITAIKEMGDAQASAGLSVGIQDERGATAGLSGGISIKDPSEKPGGIQTSASLENIGVSLSSSKGASAGASVGISFAAATSVQGRVRQTSTGLSIPLWTPVTGFLEASWGEWDVYINGFQEDHYYGFLYSDDSGMGCQSGTPCYETTNDSYSVCPTCPATTPRVKKMDYNISGDFLQTSDNQNNLKLGYTGEDLYSVQSQGLSGTFKPYRPEDGDYYTYLSNQDYAYQTQCQDFLGSWFGVQCSRNGVVNYGDFFEGGVNVGPTPIISRNHHSSVYSQRDSLIWRFDSELGGGLFNDRANRDADNTPPVIHTVSKKIKPIYVNAQIAGWIITSEDGVKYVYTTVVYNTAEQTIASDNADLSTWTKRETPSFAYAWLLTAILSTDYVKMSTGSCVQDTEEACLPSNGDIGGWVRFKYTQPISVYWRTPIGAISSAASFGLVETNNSFVTSYSAAMGLKTVRYLDTIETPTHVATLQLGEQPRKDSQAPPYSGEIGFPITIDTRNTTTSPYNPVPCPVNPSSPQNQTYKYVINLQNLSKGSNLTVIVDRESYQQISPEGRSPGYCLVSPTEDVLPEGTVDASGSITFTIDNSTVINSIRGEYPTQGQESQLPGTSNLSYLQGISLFNKNFGNKEVSSVKFAYDYSLAQSSPNSVSSSLNGDGGDQGRLTLKSVQTGATSNGPWNPPYLFNYEGPNPTYSMIEKDYWGYYCTACVELERQPDGSANAWNLTKITAPSGTEIQVDYEPTTVDYSEGLPISFDGDSIGNYFTIDSAPVSFINFFNTGTGAFLNQSYADQLINRITNPNSIPVELADQFKGHYVEFLGRFDIPLVYNEYNNFTIEGEIADLGNLPSIPGATYIIESPTIFNEPSSVSNPWYVFFGNTTVANEQNGIDVPSTRIMCPDAPNPDIPNYLCPSYRVGVTSSLPFNNTNQNNRIVVFNNTAANTPIAKTPQWVRVWAILPKTQGSTKPVVYGGGVRVSKLTFLEPFTNKANTVLYSYQDAATATLPQTQSNYSLDFIYKESQGVKPYLGGAGILHGKVTTKFQFANSLPYTSEYNFLTSKDLPVKLLFSTISPTLSGNLQSIVQILDRSSLWGSLWKKVDRNSSNQIVRTDSTEWASRINDTWKKYAGMIGQNLDLNKEGQSILNSNDPNIPILPTSENSVSTDTQYFGITQKLWSNRYISENCESDAVADRDACIEGDKGAISTQIEVLRFAALGRQEFTTQDGLTKKTESNLFDFKTGAPLLQIQQNQKSDGTSEFYATLKSPADRHYSDMLDSNMLTQTFSSTLFRFDTDPSAEPWQNLPILDLAKVVSSQFTLWGDYGSASTKPHLYRQVGDYKLRDLSNFHLPDVSDASDPNWVSQGTNTKYDDFSHVVEFKDAVGHNTAEIYGYGQSMPTAFIQNAKSNEVFYHSFELADEYPDSASFTNWVATKIRAKTGDQSLRVENCQEPGSNSKPGCSNSNNSNQWLTCFKLPPLTLNKTYTASAWYYDEYQGSDPNNPQNTAFTNAPTQVTRPGIFIGDDVQYGSCAAEEHPNGAVVAPGQIAAPAANGDWNADQRALGERNWKRIWTDFTPPSTCSSSGTLNNAYLCLYASKGEAGSDVYYDEVRVRPKNALMTTYAYDANGNMISTADANEVTKHFTYDAFGNLTGMKNDDGVLLSEQAKKYADRSAGATYTFPDRTPAQSSNCAPPVITDRNGQPLVTLYTLINSSNPQVATIQNGNVCTENTVGTSDIQIKTPDGTVTVPITVKWSQLATMTMDCEDINTLTHNTAYLNYNGCAFDISELENQLADQNELYSDGTYGNVWVFNFHFNSVSEGSINTLESGAPNGLQAPSVFDGKRPTSDINDFLDDNSIPNYTALSFPYNAMYIVFNIYTDPATPYPVSSINYFSSPPMEPPYLSVSLPTGVTADSLAMGYTSLMGASYTFLNKQDIFNNSGNITTFSEFKNSIQDDNLDVIKTIAVPSNQLSRITGQDISLVKVWLGYFISPTQQVAACITAQCQDGGGQVGKVTVTVSVY